MKKIKAHHFKLLNSLKLILLKNNHLQRSKQSSLSDSTAEKVQQNKLHNNNRPIFIDENDDEFEGSGRKGEVSNFVAFFNC